MNLYLIQPTGSIGRGLDLQKRAGEIDRGSSYYGW